MPKKNSATTWRRHKGIYECQTKSGTEKSTDSCSWKTCNPHYIPHGSDHNTNGESSQPQASQIQAPRNFSEFSPLTLASSESLFWIDNAAASAESLSDRNQKNDNNRSPTTTKKWHGKRTLSPNDENLHSQFRSRPGGYEIRRERSKRSNVEGTDALAHRQKLRRFHLNMRQCRSQFNSTTLSVLDQRLRQLLPLALRCLPGDAAQFLAQDLRLQLNLPAL